MFYKYLHNWKEERILKSHGFDFYISMIDNTPLTRRLEAIAGDTFNVKVKEQRSDHHSNIKPSYMSSIIKGFMIYRSVDLNIKNYNYIQAESFISVKHVNGRENFMRILKNRSLGSYILKSKRFKKRSVKFKIIKDRVVKNTLYIFKNKKLEVNEIFPLNYTLQKTNILEARKNI